MGDFERSLKSFQKKVEQKVERATAETSVGELFNDGFMRTYTDFQNFGAMVEAWGLGPALRKPSRRSQSRTGRSL